MTQRKSQMTRSQLLAAEIFGYSFDNYADHLGIGNARFDSLMPKDAETLERAELESWPIGRLARSLQVDELTARSLLDGFARARTVVDADNPAETLRHAVRFLVSDATAQGLSSDEAIEDLVRQICYRVADLGYLLDIVGQPLSRYSRHLRREPDVQYYDGYFDDDA